MIIVWLEALCAIFIVMLCYFALNEVVLRFLDWFSTTYYSTLVENACTILTYVWQWFPILFIIGILIWAYMQMHRREYIYGQA